MLAAVIMVFLYGRTLSFKENFENKLQKMFEKVTEVRIASNLIYK